jgi:hypothetical protein
MKTRLILAPLVLGPLLLAPGVAAAGIKLYSYDPADAATKESSGALTFRFFKGLLGQKVLEVYATEGNAQAEVDPAGPPPGAGPLEVRNGGFYRIRPDKEGDALVAGLCPGSSRGWLSIGPLRAYQDLEVHMLSAPANGPVTLCRTLIFRFRGEWKTPKDALDPRVFQNLPQGSIHP